MRSQLAAHYVTIGHCNNVQSCGQILPPSIKGSGGGDRLGGSTTVRRHPLRPPAQIVAGATMSDFRGQEP